jgi:CHAT domain-containing protein
MDEQRFQAYVELIQQLLSCAQGEEAALLEANAELVDAGLVAAMGQVADWMESQGNSNAGWLRQFAGGVAQALGLTEGGSLSAGDAAGFLGEIVQLIAQTQGDRAQVYGFFRENVARLDEALLRVLPEVFALLIRQNDPAMIAAVFGEFGNLIQQFPLGNRMLNLETGIAAYEQALSVRTQTAMPIEWAQTTMNLATAYKNRIKGDSPEERLRQRAENIEQAIAAYEQALSVMTQTAMPIDWAQTTNNLATAYYSRIKGDRAENIEQAIAAYEQALSVMTQTAMPIEWATTTMNLATAYYSRIKGDSPEERLRQRAENIEQAIAAYEQALTVMTEALPDDCRKTGRLLANLYSDQSHWSKATTTYQIALQAAEICYQRSDFLDSKSAELSTTAELPRRAAYAYAKTGDLTQAIVTLEQGRARGLSESLNRDRSDLKSLSQQNPTLHTQYQTITTQLRDLETQQRNPDSTLTRPEIQTRIQTLSQQLQNTINQIRQVPTYEDFLTPTKWEDIQNAVTRDRPLVYLVTTPNGGMALTVIVDAVTQCCESRIDVLWLDDLKEATLQEILYGPADEKELSRYLGAYQDFRNDSKTNYPAWCQEIDTTTRQLWDSLMGPIVQQLKTKGFKQATLIPTGYLSLLPLHAAWTPDPSKPTGKRYALDDIHFTYSPNAKSLTAAQAIAHQVKPDSILAIDNPRNDLPNSQREIDCAIDSFRDRTVLRHNNATIDTVKSALSKAAIVHFSCHGTAKLNEPLNSGLLMSDDLLILKDLFALNLADNAQGNQGIRLAILSACETGLPGLKTIDEVVSLPIGLMQAGVAGVVSSLWSVSDLSTMMLLTKFYDLWRKHSLAPDQALHQAQQWMHSTTDGQKADYCGLAIAKSQRDNRTYAHPFHWAAFSYLGL